MIPSRPYLWVRKQGEMRIHYFKTPLFALKASSKCGNTMRHPTPICPRVKSSIFHYIPRNRNRRSASSSAIFYLLEPFEFHPTRLHALSPSLNVIATHRRHTPLLDLTHRPPWCTSAC